MYGIGAPPEKVMAREPDVGRCWRTRTQVGRKEPERLRGHCCQAGLKLWVDANVDVLDDYIFNEMGKTSSKLLIPLHFNRDCIYKEIESLYNLPRKESADVLDEMRIVLQNNKMPQHYGLNETNLIFRRHNDSQIINIMEEWWSFIRKISKRDQVSLSFVLWKNGLKPSDIAIPNARRIKSFFISDNHQTMIFNSQIYNWNTVSQVWKL